MKNEKIGRSETWFLLMTAEYYNPFDGSLRLEDGRLMDVQDLETRLSAKPDAINRILRLLQKKGLVKREKLPNCDENKRAIIIQKELIT